mmetsp:Transcript_7730/g.25646  ORF Transcript_7730/g.25646 Transcript_7730/m.25646 type:complete len:261 (+) Transcript_7730:401-1183(+)
MSERAQTSMSAPFASTTGRALTPTASMSASAEASGASMRVEQIGERSAAIIPAPSGIPPTPLAPAAPAPVITPPRVSASTAPRSPRCPPCKLVHVPIGSEPIGCERSGRAAGTPRKCRAMHASTPESVARCKSCGTSADVAAASRLAIPLSGSRPSPPTGEAPKTSNGTMAQPVCISVCATVWRLSSGPTETSGRGEPPFWTASSRQTAIVCLSSSASEIGNDAAELNRRSMCIKSPAAIMPTNACAASSQSGAAIIPCS